ncbi:MAG: tetratricopeptide repeat protein [Acidobacteriia bacterium]|nr:tetratricopeptide repeat protein [Terriglobia bacterium]
MTSRVDRLRRALLLPSLVAVAAFAVYLGACRNGFALDDLPVVRDNPDIRSLSGVPALFARPYWPGRGGESGLYRPVTISSYAINLALTGPGPAGFHLLNVLLNAMVAFLTWLVARRAGLETRGATVAGLVFAVHPLHAEAVANVAGRAEILAATGVLCAWLCHRRSADSAARAARAAWAALASFWYLAAILSKEGAIAAPLLIALDDAARRRERPRSRLAPFSLASYAGFLVAVGVDLVLRAHALGGLSGAEDAAFLDNPAAALGAVPRLLTAPWVLVRYAALVIWPARLSSDHSFDAIPVVSSPADPRFLAGLLLIAALLAALFLALRRSRTLAVSIGAWLVFLLPVSNFVFPTGTVMAERLAYLPLLGPCLLAGWAFERVRGARDCGARRALVPAVTAIFLVALAVRTWMRVPAFSDNATLALRDVEVEPRSAKLHAGAAIALHAAGRTEEAARHYEAALAIYPDYAQMHYDYALLLAARGERRPAMEHLRRASELSPANPKPFKALAGLLEQEGRTAAALEAYAAGARLDPGDRAFRVDRRRALLSAGRIDEAREVLASVAAEDPLSIPGLLSNALLREIRGDRAGAAAIYRGLLSRPDLPGAVRGRARRSLAELDGGR